MKKYSGIVLVFILFLGISVSSCEDMLDTDPKSYVEEKDFFKHQEEVNAAVAGVYTQLIKLTGKYLLVTELKGDLMRTTVNAPRYLQEMNKHSVSKDNPLVAKQDYYDVIFSCNKVLENLDKVKENDKDIRPEELAGIAHEMILVRTWTYFTLARLYNSVVYTETAVEGFTGNEPLLPQEQMVEKLIETLEASMAKERTKDYAATFSGLPTKEFVVEEQLYADLLLWKGDYQQAADVYFKFLQFGDNTKVNEDHKLADWKAVLWGGEAVMEMNLYPFTHNLYEMTIKDYWLAPADSVLQAWSLQKHRAGDGTGDRFRGEGVSFSTDGEPKIFKYYDPEEDFGRYEIQYERGAGMHLKWAEALNRLGEHETALKLLNGGYESEDPEFKGNIGVRRRAGLKDVELDFSYLEEGKVPDAQDSMIQIENAIIDERALELAFEGGRWFDLMRVAKRRGDNAFLADRVASKFPEAERESIRLLLMDESKWYFLWK
ncbi:MAG: RagB/SusD family nutrient uptake outer membrane protein [Cytophagales bacterium]|nr:RagB/SusD family nutrient uptake outer membrane protein [Cytophagales bacterium]